MTLDTILLNVNMGLGLIDENLEGLMSYMKNVPLAFSLVGMAKSIGLAIALGVGAYETYMMMLGRRGMDVMKILRILILAICISNSGWIAKALQEPGEILMEDAKSAHEAIYAQAKDKEMEASALQEQYMAKLKNAMDSIHTQERVDVFVKKDFWDKLMDGVMAGATGGLSRLAELATEEVSNYTKEGSAMLIGVICEGLQFLIRFIGEVIFQMIYYAMLVTQRIVLYLMTLFMPLAFALSLAPPYKSAWSQYIAKFLSVTLWGFVIYVMMFFVDNILYYFISLDCEGYQRLLNVNVGGSWSDVATLGLQGIGSTCMYVVAMLIGAKVLSMAPEVAGWLIPGGVSSSMGGMAAATATGIASTVGGFAGSAAGGAVGAVTGGAVTTYGAVGAGVSAHKQGATMGQSIRHAIVSQTGFGKAADAGAKSSTPFTDWGKHKK